MLFQIGKRGLIKNTALLAKLYSKDLTSESLRANYLEYVKGIQIKNRVCTEKDTQWIYSLDKVLDYVKLFSEDSIVNDLQQQNVINPTLYKEAEGSSKLERTQRAFEKLKNIFPDFYDVFKLNIHTVFSAPSAVAGGGSTSGAVGVIWSNPQDHWQEQDIFEILIHEYTHNAMFIDELCSQHYVSLKEVAKEENYTISAILKKRRPLDKVLHALAVGVEVLAARHYVLGHPTKPCAHPPTEMLLLQTEKSIESIRELKNLDALLTLKGKEVVDRCERLMLKIKAEYLGNTNVA